MSEKIIKLSLILHSFKTSKEYALLPKLQGIVIDFGGRGVADILILGVSEVNFSFLLPLFCFFYLSWYGFRVSNKNTISP